MLPNVAVVSGWCNKISVSVSVSVMNLLALHHINSEPHAYYMVAMNMHYVCMNMHYVCMYHIAVTLLQRQSRCRYVRDRIIFNTHSERQI